MKKTKLISLLLVLLFMLSVTSVTYAEETVVSSGTTEGTEPVVEIVAKKIRLNKSSLKLNVHSGFQLEASITPANVIDQTITFESSKPTVATVSETGYIQALRKGKTTITAKTANGKKATCKVTVSIPKRSNKTVNTSIEKYGMPKELGKAQLTVEEVEALVGKPPEELQRAICTAPDLLQYFISANYGLGGGDNKRSHGNLIWHTNNDAITCLNQNKGNCGGTANVVNFILSGDYDEVGYIQYSGIGDGHVYNYIKTNDKYYIIDYIQYTSSNYRRYNYKIRRVKNLNEYKQDCVMDYKGTNEEGRDITPKLIWAYAKTGSHYPIGDHKNEAAGRNPPPMRVLPEGANVLAIMETPEEGFVFDYQPCPFD